MSQAFAAQRVFLEIASNSKQPAQDAFQALLADTSKWMLEVQVGTLHEPFFHMSIYAQISFLSDDSFATLQRRISRTATERVPSSRNSALSLRVFLLLVCTLYHS